MITPGVDMPAPSTALKLYCSGKRFGKSSLRREIMTKASKKDLKKSIKKTKAKVAKQENKLKKLKKQLKKA
ncbi:hypothetical protein FCN78_15360 [Salinivibrio kushneri]|uniref:hypothetical protein n=1 Tax=Salinivibrio kushneri TaxID=1908198 RepID=UPI0010C8192C|nr:hypothetical protein [Salinivibrio kushneri]QCP03780.1 hypothetical protein FCN78_15360 [Salinivibrio kushneri]